MYHAELEEGELLTMTLVQAREMFLIAYVLKLFHLMKHLLARVIIPRMDKSMCFEFLKDSFERDDAKLIWKTLQHYCINFFAYNSKSIMNKSINPMNGLEIKLIYKLVSKALMQCKDIEHMYVLLGILVEHGFGANLLDIIEKIPLVNEINAKKFDLKYIPYKDDIFLSLEAKKCYSCDLITSEGCYMNGSLSGKILEERDYNNSAASDASPGASASKSATAKKANENNTPSKKTAEFNHLDLNMRYNSKSHTIPSGNQWPEIKRRDPNNEIKIDIDPSVKNKTIISQAFDSESRSWNLVLDVEED